MILPERVEISHDEDERGYSEECSGNEEREVVEDDWHHVQEPISPRVRVIKLFLYLSLGLNKLDRLPLNVSKIVQYVCKSRSQCSKTVSVRDLRIFILS